MGWTLIPGYRYRGVQVERAGTYRRAVLRRTVRKRRIPTGYHYQERQARDGWRVQSRTVSQGISGTMHSHRNGISPGWSRRLWLAPNADRPVWQIQGTSQTGRTQEPADRSSDSRSRSRCMPGILHQSLMRTQKGQKNRLPIPSVYPAIISRFSTPTSSKAGQH